MISLQNCSKAKTPAIHNAIISSKKMNKKLFDRLTQIKDGRVLDIGFQYPHLFFPLYHTFKFKTFAGVDKASMLQCLNSFKELKGNKPIIKRLQAVNSFFDVYDITANLTQNPFSKLNETDFNNIFFNNLKFEEDAQVFLENHKNEKYDFINLSNIIQNTHADVLSQKIILDCIDMLTPLGIMYIRVQSTNTALNQHQCFFLNKLFNDKQQILAYKSNDEIKCVELWYYK
jgi:hypothetical protein